MNLTQTIKLLSIINIYVVRSGGSFFPPWIISTLWKQNKEIKKESRGKIFTAPGAVGLAQSFSLLHLRLLFY